MKHGYLRQSATLTLTMNLSDRRFCLPGYTSLIILMLLITTCGGEIKQGSGVTVISYEEDTDGLARLSPQDYTRGGVMHEHDSLSYAGTNMESSQTQVLKISDFREIISLDIIQHEKVNLVLTHGHVTSDEIRAHLYVPDCLTGRACPQLSCNVTHSDLRSHVSLFVQQNDPDYNAGVCVMWTLVFIAAVLCFWYGIRLIKTMSTEETGQEKHRYSDKNLNIGQVTDDIDDNTSSSSHHHDRSDCKLQNGHVVKCNRDVHNSHNVTNKERWCEQCDCAWRTMSPERRGSHSAVRVSWSSRPWVGLCLGVVVCLLLGALYVNGGKLYSEKQRGNAVLTVEVPEKAHIRHVRSYSTSPDLRDVTMDNSLALITRLQLLDLTTECRDNVTQCRTHAVCEGKGGDSHCRCNRGYYMRDLTCTACTTSCDDGFYMSSQCSEEKDVICKPCRQCEGTSYMAAPCTTTQDTICIDVTFPLKQFEQRTSLQTLVELNATMSVNVFLERLHHIKKLETPLYMSSNRQELEFVWRRPSGLAITVKVSDIYLVPVYVDLDYDDDMKYIKDVKNKIFPKDTKNRLNTVIDQYCRHPLPDGYDLILNIARNISTPAREMTCDSKNFNLHPCPRPYKEGDKYVYKALDRRCHKAPGNVPTYTKKANNILCMDNPEILTKVFRMSVNSSTTMTFQSDECKKFAHDCRHCLLRRVCERGTNSSDCCNKDCYARNACQQLYSANCPETPIECARGDITKYSMIPQYQNIRQQYACHLRHRPPRSLYLVSYEASIPSMHFSLGERRKEVLFHSGRLQEDGVERADYLHMLHHTILPVHDDVILVGTFSTPRSPATYTLHKLKKSQEFNRRPFDVMHQDGSYKTSMQFETPFLYTASSWNHEGCDRNMSRIVPQQPIYRQIGEPLETPIKKRPKRKGGVTVGPFVYQLRGVGTAPHIRFSTPEDTSILSYYKEELADAKLNATSLRGSVMWDRLSQLWNLTIAGAMTTCPGYFTAEIFTKSSFTRMAVYDVLIKCPQDFRVTFQISRATVDVPDLFTVVLNDSVSSYRVVVASIQAPQYFTGPDNKVADMATKESSPWIPIIVVLSVCLCTSIFLLIIYMYCDGQKSKLIPTDITVPKPDLGPQITLLQNIDTGTSKVRMSLQTKCIIVTLATLYIVYAFMFTFTSLFGLLHVIHGADIRDVSFVSNTNVKLKSHMHMKLQMMVDYENDETSRMIKSVEERLHACGVHLKSSFYKEVPEINKQLTTTLRKIFKQNGTVQSSLTAYFEDRMALYEHKIKQFVEEFNKTLEENLHTLHSAYSAYLTELTDNHWFDFPRQLFLAQQSRQGERLSEVKDKLAKFLTWLEIDKVREIIGIKNMLLHRLTTMMPTVNFSSILDDQDPSDDVTLTMDAPTNWYNFTSSGGYESLDKMLLSDLKNENSDTASGVGSTDNLISNIKSIIYPLFISVFLGLDILLLAYRISWMSECIRRFGSGVEQRVPYDSVTRNIHFILTGEEVSRPGDSLDYPYDYYMSNKDNIWANNPEQYFLYCHASPKSKEDILRELLTHKRSQKPKSPTDIKQRSCCIVYGLKLAKLVYRLFISLVFWRFLLICAFVLFLCLVTKATDDLVTMESAMFLIDTDAMLPILARQNLITNTIISQHGDYLNDFLASYKGFLDSEIEVLNQVLVDATSKQSSLLTAVISDVCNLGDGVACLGSPGIDVLTFTFTSCNFLPLQIRPYTGFHGNIISEFLVSELSPLVGNLRSILFNAFYLLLTFAAAMLLCQICARIVYVYLCKSRHLRTTKIYQLPSTVDPERQSFREKDVYVSQSLIAESCESGVYDMTA